MNTQQAITKLLQAVQSQTETLFFGDSRVQLEMHEGILTIFVIDTEENVMYPVGIEDSDDLLNKSKLIDEIINHVKSEQRRLENDRVTFNHLAEES